MSSRKKKLALLALGVVWMSAIAAGATRLRRYADTPGDPGTPPAVWPGASTLVRATDRPTLVMAVHLECPCSRASLAELRRIMDAAAGQLAAYVLVATPRGDNHRALMADVHGEAAMIPGVQVVRDDDGAEAQHFGAQTSGHTELFARDGRRVFAGGITASRGHAGDNEGSASILAWLAGRPASERTPVFGCPMRAGVL